MKKRILRAIVWTEEHHTELNLRSREFETRVEMGNDIRHIATDDQGAFVREFQAAVGQLTQEKKS